MATNKKKKSTAAKSQPPGTRRVDEWPRPQNREPGGYFPFAVAPVALSKPVGTRFNAEGYDTWQAETGHHRSWT